jgi:hypothetical protein
VPVDRWPRAMLRPIRLRGHGQCQGPSLWLEADTGGEWRAMGVADGNVPETEGKGRQRRGVMAIVLAIFDWLTDPDKRPRRLAAAVLGILGVLVAVLTLRGGGDDKPDIPVIEGEIGHLSTPTGLADAEQGDVLRLDLDADSLRISVPSPTGAPEVVDPTCDDGHRGDGVCEVTWVDECDEAPSEADLKNSLDLAPDCRFRSIRTVVDETGATVDGWTYNDGVWELNGYYTVVETGMQNDNKWMALRKVRVEDARQMVE